MTKKELEILCQAYLDCRLSRQEERELALMLAAEADMDTGVVGATRRLMGLELRYVAASAAAAEASAAEGALVAERPARRLMLRRRWAVAAGVAAMLLCVLAWKWAHPVHAPAPPVALVAESTSRPAPSPSPVVAAPKAEASPAPRCTPSPVRPQAPTDEAMPEIAPEALERAQALLEQVAALAEVDAVVQSDEMRRKLEPTSIYIISL